VRGGLARYLSATLGKPVGLLDRTASRTRALRTPRPSATRGGVGCNTSARNMPLNCLERRYLCFTKGVVVLMSLVVACTSAGSPQPTADPASSSKIHFDLRNLDQDGLYGPPDSRRAMAYEFCIPDREDLADEVRSVDASVYLTRTAPGRIGCGGEQLLCVGSTGQTNFRRVLTRLAELVRTASYFKSCSGTSPVLRRVGD
jgi:hypothetical protein